MRRNSVASWPRTLPQRRVPHASQPRSHPRGASRRHRSSSVGRDRIRATTTRTAQSGDDTMLSPSGGKRDSQTRNWRGMAHISQRTVVTSRSVARHTLQLIHHWHGCTSDSFTSEVQVRWSSFMGEACARLYARSGLGCSQHRVHRCGQLCTAALYCQTYCDCTAVIVHLPTASVVGVGRLSCPLSRTPRSCMVPTAIVYCS